MIGGPVTRGRRKRRKKQELSVPLSRLIREIMGMWGQGDLVGVYLEWHTSTGDKVCQGSKRYVYTESITQLLCRCMEAEVGMDVITATVRGNERVAKLQSFSK